MKSASGNKAWSGRRAGGQDGMSLIGLLVLLLLVAGGVYWWMGRGKVEEEPPEETPLTRLQTAAEGGDAVAAWKLGKIYAEGVEVEQDWSQAVKWFRMSAQAGNSEGEYQFGLLFEKGNGVPQDWGQAVGWYLKAAERGHADAQWKMGICHRDGREVPQDPIWAKVWLEKAARQGQKEAQEALKQLEVMLAKGINPVELERAEAEGGDAAAQCRMGRRFMEGVGVGKDEAAGAEWYRKAAEQGYAPGQCQWGDCLRLGRGVGADMAAAEEWYHKAADQGYVEGQLSMAKCRMAAGEREEAVVWLKKAAEGQHPEGQYLLAMCYQKGLGIATDKAKAKKWLQAAARNGHDKAQAVLARDSGELAELGLRAKRGDRRAQYELGRELIRKRREKDGLGWIQASAQGGNADAAIWLARYYDDRDAREAFQWWNRAADYGSAEARWQMVEMCQRGVGTSFNAQEARRWVRKLAEGGDRKAMLMVAESYERGLDGTPKNYREAKNWYVRAGDLNSAERMDRFLSGKGRY